MKVVNRRAALLAAGLSLGCGPREDVTPQIAVQPGAAARAMQLTGKWAANPEPRPPAVPTSTASVRPLQSAAELGGPNVRGGAGDWLLENDEVAFVVARGEGVVLDAVDARARKDELERVSLDLGARRVVWDAVSSGAAPDHATAWVEARGHEASAVAVTIVTRFTLHAGDRALLLETTVTNGSDQSLDALSFGDSIDWGGAEPFAPAGGAFVGAVGRATSYALTSTDGTIQATTDPARPVTVTVQTAQAAPVSLAPKGALAFARVLVVGARPDVAGLVAELTRASGGPLGSLDISLVDEAGRAVAPPGGAKVLLGKPTGEVTMTLRAADGVPFGGDVPPGDYLITFASGGGRGASAASPGRSSARVTVRANEHARVRLVVGEPGFLSFSCLEALGPVRALARVPCKVTVTGVAGTRAPEIAPPLAGGARNQIAVADGRVGLALAPGKYHVVVTRGLARLPVEWDAEVAPGRTTWGPREGAAVLRRTVDSRGYLALDLSPRETTGADAADLARAQATLAAAEGADVVLGELDAPRSKTVPAFGWIPARDLEGAEAWFSTEPAVAALFASAPVAEVRGRPGWTYVRVLEDSAVTGWPPEREADLLAGLRDRRDVVVGDGPFLQVTAGDAPIGGVARARAGRDVEVKVHVECPASQAVDRVQLLRAVGEAPAPQPVTLRPSPLGGRAADATFHVRATKDDVFVAVASSGAGDEATSHAMSGPLWIDADGDGTALGRTPPPPPPPPPKPDPRKEKKR